MGGGLMKVLCILWKRRLGGYMDGALSLWETHRVQRHLAGCSHCQREVRELERLRSLLKNASVISEPDPDWSRFWPGVHAKILSLGDRAEKQTWWRRLLWNPVSGHPRLAFGSALVGIALLAFVFWQGPSWWAGPPPAEAVTVHSVETADPESSVMVFTSSDKVLTVVWVFGLDQGTDNE